MQKNNYHHYKVFSEVLKYPSEQLFGMVNQYKELLKEHYPDALIHFDTFSEWVLNTPLDEMEEIYTKTFHIQAICYLDLGFVIFGEDYKRGEFLVKMKMEQKKANNDCGTELADNLLNVLTLIPKLEDHEIRKELAVRVLIPAIRKMLDEFKSSRMALKEKVMRKKHKAILMENQRNGNIYQYALRSLLSVFEKDFEGIKYEEPNHALSATIRGFESVACGSACSFINKKPIETVRK